MYKSDIFGQVGVQPGMTYGPNGPPNSLERYFHPKRVHFYFRPSLQHSSIDMSAAPSRRRARCWDQLSRQAVRICRLSLELQAS